MLSEIVTTGNGQAPLRNVKSESSDSLYRETTMRVRKRNGSSEPVDLNKIVRAVSRSCAGLSDVDALRVATKTISGLYDGATTRELDQLSIQTGRGADRRGAPVREARGAPARDLHRQGGPQPGDPRLLAVGGGGSPARPRQRAAARRSWPRTRAS